VERVPLDKGERASSAKVCEGTCPLEIETHDRCGGLNGLQRRKKIKPPGKTHVSRCFVAGGYIIKRCRKEIVVRCQFLPFRQGGGVSVLYAILQGEKGRGTVALSRTPGERYSFLKKKGGLLRDEEGTREFLKKRLLSPRREESPSSLKKPRLRSLSVIITSIKWMQASYQRRVLRSQTG